MNTINKQYTEKAILYADYIDLNIRLVEEKKTSGDDQTEEKIHFTGLNLHRMQRMNRTIVINPELENVVKQLRYPITMLVITESWCGDAAQQMPWFAKLTELNNNLSLKILFRDDNPDLMKDYLTNGKKSIPVTLFINEENQVIWKLGSRPYELVRLMEEWAREDLKKEEKLTRVHTWYAKNRGEALQGELKGIFEQLK